MLLKSLNFSAFVIKVGTFYILLKMFNPNLGETLILGAVLLIWSALSTIEVIINDKLTGG